MASTSPPASMGRSSSRSLSSGWTRVSICSPYGRAVAPRPDPRPGRGSVGGGSGAGAGLADPLEQVGEPGRGDVERLAALDPRELDRPQLVAALLVVPDHAGLAAERAVDGQLGHRADELEVGVVGGRGTGEVAGLLHQDLFRPEQLGEPAGEPLPRVDLVDLDVAEGVAGDLLPRAFELGDDRAEAGALGDEEVDRADRVHDVAQPLAL